MPRSLLQNKPNQNHVRQNIARAFPEFMLLVIVQRLFILPCFCIQYKWRQLLMIPYKHKPFGAEQWAQTDELAYLGSFINYAEIKLLLNKDGVIYSHARRCYHWLKIETHFKDKIHLTSFSTTFSRLREKIIFPIKLNHRINQIKLLILEIRPAHLAYILASHILASIANDKTTLEQTVVNLLLPCVQSDISSMHIQFMDCAEITTLDNYMFWFGFFNYKKDKKTPQHRPLCFHCNLKWPKYKMLSHFPHDFNHFPATPINKKVNGGFCDVGIYSNYRESLFFQQI